jgi:hypothetical protein
MRAAQRHRFGSASRLALFAFACLAPFATLSAQQSAAPQAAPPAGPAHDIPPPDQLEPGVNTTALPPAATDTPSVAPAAPAAPADASAAPRSPRSARTAAQEAAAAPKAAASAPGARKGPDRLQLDTTEITGNRELPKVLYIVPWKRSDLGDLMGRPVNSLLDEVLQPLDRDVFQRENRYYDALKPDAAAAPAAAPGGTESKP